MAFVYHFHKNTVKLVAQNDLGLDEVTLALPSGLYTTFRTLESGTRVIGLNAHFDRLSLRDDQRSILRNTLREVIRRTKGSSPEWKIRIYRDQIQEPDWWIMLEPFSPPTDQQRMFGVRVNVSTVRRDVPAIKSTSFIQKSLGERADNKQSGIYESLIVANN